MFGLIHNLYKHCRKQKEGRHLTIIVIGIDNAGKSTLISSIKKQPKLDTVPNLGADFGAKGISIGRHTIDFFDVGGGRAIRGIWSSYFAEVHAAVFVVDSADPGRLEEAKAALHEAVGTNFLAGKPLLIFANKQDLPTAAEPAQIANGCSLEKIKQCRYHIQACQALPLNKEAAGTGVDPVLDKRINEGLRWLFEEVDKQWNTLSTRVQQDTESEKERKRIEKEARKKRVEALREERRKKQEEEERQAKQEAGAGITAEAGSSGVASPEATWLTHPLAPVEQPPDNSKVIDPLLVPGTVPPPDYPQQSQLRPTNQSHSEKSPRGADTSITPAKAPAKLAPLKHAPTVEVTEQANFK